LLARQPAEMVAASIRIAGGVCDAHLLPQAWPYSAFAPALPAGNSRIRRNIRRTLPAGRRNRNPGAGRVLAIPAPAPPQTGYPHDRVAAAGCGPPAVETPRAGNCVGTEPCSM